jgi:hypothetical protein
MEVVTGQMVCSLSCAFLASIADRDLAPLTDIGAYKSRIEPGSIVTVCGAKTPAGGGIKISAAAAYKKAGSRLFVGKSFPYSPLEVVPTIG